MAARQGRLYVLLASALGLHPQKLGLGAQVFCLYPSCLLQQAQGFCLGAVQFGCRSLLLAFLSQGFRRLPFLLVLGSLTFSGLALGFGVAALGFRKGAFLFGLQPAVLGLLSLGFCLLSQGLRLDALGLLLHDLGR